MLASAVTSKPGPKSSGHHSVGRELSNGTLLQQTCAQHELVITNTLFQQANKYKTTWMHPRSEHWHMLEYVITRQPGVRSAHITRVMRGTSCWFDHRLVRCLVFFWNLLPPKHWHASVWPKKLNVDMLKPDEVKLQPQVKMDDILACDQQYDNIVRWGGLETH